MKIENQNVVPLEDTEEVLHIVIPESPLAEEWSSEEQALGCFSGAAAGCITDLAPGCITETLADTRHEIRTR